MKKTTAIDIISSMLLLLFLYTAISKIADYANFKNVLSQSPFLNPLASAMAWVLPASEIIIAVLLFIPATRMKGFYACFFLLLLFTIYLIYMVLMTPHLPCNCGGVIKNLSWAQHIFFNLFFVLLSLAGILLNRKNKKVVSAAPT